MLYVLVIVTVFSSSSGVATDTRFHEFRSQSACESARAGIEAGLRSMEGTMAREVLAQCFEKG